MNIQKCPLTEDEKTNMISEAAFLKSKGRPQPGDREADWLQAERDVQNSLASECRSKQSRHDQSVYERMRREVIRILAKAEGAVNQETIQLVLAKVTAQMRQKGSFVPETIDSAANRLKSEFNGGVEALKHQWVHFKIRQKQVLACWKIKGDKVLVDWKDKSNEVLNDKARAFYEWTSKHRNNNRP